MISHQQSHSITHMHSTVPISSSSSTSSVSHMDGIIESSWYYVPYQQSHSITHLHLTAHLSLPYVLHIDQEVFRYRSSSVSHQKSRSFTHMHSTTPISSSSHHYMCHIISHNLSFICSLKCIYHIDGIIGSTQVLLISCGQLPYSFVTTQV